MMTSLLAPYWNDIIVAAAIVGLVLLLLILQKLFECVKDCCTTCVKCSACCKNSYKCCQCLCGCLGDALTCGGHSRRKQLLKHPDLELRQKEFDLKEQRFKQRQAEAEERQRLRDEARRPVSQQTAWRR